MIKANMKKYPSFDVEPHDEEEREFMEDYEAGHYVPVPHMEEEIERHMQIAQNTIRKNKNVNIRLSEGNIMKLKQKALETGLPYQTIISTLIHQYVEGKIKMEI